MKNKIISIFVVFLIIGFVSGFFVRRELSVDNDSVEGDGKRQVDIGGIGFVVDEGTDLSGVNIEPVNDAGPNPKIKAPSLNRLLVFSTNTPDEIKAVMTDNIEKVVGSLKKDGSVYDNWMQLAIYRKAIDDYKGAEEIWVYLTKAWPNLSIPFGNLGDLYTFYLKDNKKAEEYFLKAIEIENNNTAWYRGLHNLYRYSYKTDTASASSILLQGLKTMPDNIDLMTLLASYYKEKGDNVSAKKYYAESAELALKLGNPDLADILEKEANSL